MAKKSILFVCTLLLFIGFIPITSQAYTEEEKAQAKAWLSAHGYSPDYGGAAQAYQDYLDGKFDEELGITTEGGGDDESAAEAVTEVTTEETTAHPKREMPAKKENRERTEEETAEGTGRQWQELEDGTGERDGETSLKKDGNPEDHVVEEKNGAMASASAGEQADNVRLRMITDDSGQYVSTIAEGLDDRKNEKAVIVTAVGTLWMLLVSSVVSLLRNRKKKMPSAVEEAMLDEAAAKTTE